MQALKIRALRQLLPSGLWWIQLSQIPARPVRLPTAFVTMQVESLLYQQLPIGWMMRLQRSRRKIIL